MSIFIASAILLSIGSAYAVLLKRKLAETVFLAIVTIVIIIYTSGLIISEKGLLLGICFVTFYAMICLAYNIYIVLKNKKLLFEIELLQGILLFSLFMLFALYLSYNMYWHAGDEFSYWGVSVRHMYIFDTFTTTFDPQIGSIHLPQYFPGMSILHYFFTRYSNELKEYPSYVSLYFSYFVILMPFLKKIFTKTHFLSCIFLSIVYIVAPLQFITDFSPYIYLAIDFFMGMLFGIAMLYYFVYKYEDTNYGMLMFSAAVFLLVIIKDSGVLFAMVACGVAFFDIIFFRKKDISIYLRKSPNSKRCLKFLLLIFPIVLAAFAYGSWQLNVKISNVPLYFKSISASDIIALCTNRLNEAEKNVVKMFSQAMVEDMPPFSFSMVSFVFYFIIIAMIFAYFKRNELKIKRSLLAIGVIVSGAICYETVLMILYVFSFPNRTIPSYERYSGSYMFGMQIFLLVYFLPIDKMSSWNLIRIKNFCKLVSDKLKSGRFVEYKDLKTAINLIPALLTIVITIYLFKTTYPAIKSDLLFARGRYAFLYEPRRVSGIDKWMDIIKEDSSDPTTIYVISQDHNYWGWYNATLIDYGSLYPYARIGPISEDRLHLKASTIAIDPTQYADTGIREVPTQFQPEEWEEYVLSNNLSFLYVDIADEQFIKSYGQFFSMGVQDYTLYNIQIVDGHLSLVPAELH